MVLHRQVNVTESAASSTYDELLWSLRCLFGSLFLLILQTKPVFTLSHHYSSTGTVIFLVFCGRKFCFGINCHFYRWNQFVYLMNIYSKNCFFMDFIVSPLRFIALYHRYYRAKPLLTKFQKVCVKYFFFNSWNWWNIYVALKSSPYFLEVKWKSILMMSLAGNRGRFLP